MQSHPFVFSSLVLSLHLQNQCRLHKITQLVVNKQPIAIKCMKLIIFFVGSKYNKGTKEDVRYKWADGKERVMDRMRWIEEKRHENNCVAIGKGLRLSRRHGQRTLTPFMAIWRGVRGSSDATILESFVLQLLINRRGCIARCCWNEWLLWLDWGGKWLGSTRTLCCIYLPCLRSPTLEPAANFYLPHV